MPLGFIQMFFMLYMHKPPTEGNLYIFKYCSRDGHKIAYPTVFLWNNIVVMPREKKIKNIKTR